MNKTAAAQLRVWWIVWAAFQVGVVLFYQFLGGTEAQPPHPGADSAVWLVSFAPFILSTLIRWLVLLRIRAAEPALLLFVLGIAFAEACCFLGLFIFPSHKQELFLLSCVGILQFIPVFAPRYFAEENKSLAA